MFPNNGGFSPHVTPIIFSRKKPMGSLGFHPPFLGNPHMTVQKEKGLHFSTSTSMGGREVKTHRNLVGGKHRRLTHVKVSRCEMLGDYMLPTTFYKNLKKNPFMTAVILNYPKLLVFHCHFHLNPGPWVPGWGQSANFQIYLPSKTPHLSAGSSTFGHTLSTCFARKKTVCPEICFRTICVVNLPCRRNA